VPIIDHQTDEQLELYALGRLPEPQVAVLEEHLLICPVCRDRLDEADAFAIAMRDAISGEPEEAKRTDWFGWLHRTGGLAWAGGFAVLLIAGGLYLHQNGGQAGRKVLAPVASLQLAAIRGEAPTVAPASETDLTLTDVRAEAGMRVDVVDGTGNRVWTGGFADAGATVKLGRQLNPGDYFVRLYDGTGKLLHEYGFSVRKPL